MTLTHLSLFSGIGGLDLAAEWAGIKTVGQCEYAEYQTKILEKHWPDVPRWKEIQTLTRDSFYERTGLRTVDIISGGFPCQPFSVAGKHGGKTDDRYLWPEMLRVIREIKPTWVVGENVPGIVNMALDTVLSDLENEGYEVETFIIPACGVNAWHRRDRICVMAYSDDRRGTLLGYRAFQAASEIAGEGADHGLRETADVAGQRRQRQPGMDRVDDGLQSGVVWPDTDVVCVEGSRSTQPQMDRGGLLQTESRRTLRAFPGRDYWENEPDVDRVVDGIPDRVHRLRCLGNAVVPQQFYPFFKAIALVEEV